MRNFQFTALAKVASTALLALWCAQPLTLVLHSRAHTHSYCVTHNAFEEGLQPGESPAGGSQAVGTLSSDEAPSSIPAHSGGHEECAVAAATSPEVLAPGGGAALQPSVTHHALQPWDALLAFYPLRVLDVAPKASPPASLT
ncbi:MAG: hypothetical protein L0Y66_00455 [Myxococcaceae bacterium]|nr:hypothetical protein [Myxococcaceae bacterium]